MANLKLIRVKGKPFSDVYRGCIGIETGPETFEVIKDGRTYSQLASAGDGYEYATKTDIQICWSAIYPHWTPEKGDKVIVTQDYPNWTNCKGTIIEKDPGADDYYRVESEDGIMSTFDYTSQMILAPYSKSIVEPTIEPEETATTKFKEGDRVKCIGITARGYGKLGTVRRMGESIGVEFDENVDGHYLDGCCENGYGWWIKSSDLELVTESKQETVSIRFLTKQEFVDKGLWAYTYPKGWNSDGQMNKYLGQSVVIPKSSIRSHGSFVYENWTFQATDYILSGEIPTSVSTSKSVVTPIAKLEKPPRRFKVGDKVTYKSRGESYHYGGDDQEGFVGIVEHDGEYVEDQGCYGLRVSTKDGDFCYNMLESEFYEYDSGYIPTTSLPIGSSQPATRLVIKGSSDVADSKHILVGGIAYPISSLSSVQPSPLTYGTIRSIDTDPLSSYKQKPITIKQKPKTKLTII